MKLIAVASPNHGIRPAGVTIDTVVLHADASDSEDETVRWIRSKASKVSYHTLIGRAGVVYKFVETPRRAWHAGISAFDGRENVNDFSIGLCFANRNDGVEEYTDVQYLVGAALSAEWMRKHPAITVQRFPTHAAIALPAGRKTDPGPLFDMTRFLSLLQLELQRGIPA